MDFDFAERRRKLRKSLANQPTGMMLVTNILNVRYLTGFTGSSAWLLIDADREMLLSDGRYTQQIERECPGIEAHIRPLGATTHAFAAGVLQDFAAKEILVEADSMTRADGNRLSEKLDGVTLVDSSGLVESLRAVKDANEVAIIRHSIEINERVFLQLLSELKPATTESEIGFRLEALMREHGGEGCSFDPIVATGENSALAHYRPGNLTIGDSDFLLLDWGTKYQHYASDLTRMIWFGKSPTPRMEEIYEIVLAANLAAIESVRAGVKGQDVDAVARKLIADAGFGDQFSHSLGHGIGLEIHESPSLSTVSETVLEPGMVITVEPGIYVAGVGGVRIEDDVLVTETGCEVLSSLPKAFDSCLVSLGS